MFNGFDGKSPKGRLDLSSVESMQAVLLLEESKKRIVEAPFKLSRVIAIIRPSLLNPF